MWHVYLHVVNKISFQFKSLTKKINANTKLEDGNINTILKISSNNDFIVMFGYLFINISWIVSLYLYWYILSDFGCWSRFVFTTDIYCQNYHNESYKKTSLGIQMKFAIVFVIYLLSIRFCTSCQLVKVHWNSWYMMLSKCSLRIIMVRNLSANMLFIKNNSIYLN